MKLIVFTLAFVLALPVTLIAAEIINLKVGQSGDKGFATFDLSGEIGERETEVAVSLTISGRKYAAEKLTLKGDFGKKVKTGVGKRIVWDTLTDIPAGFDGEVTWNVDAIGTPEPLKANAPPLASPALKESPFTFDELAASDKNTGLLWLRMVSKDGKAVSFGNARGAASRLSAKRFAGCSDWRLPWESELKGIMAYALYAGYKGKSSNGYAADYFNAVGFKGVVNDYYWTDTTDKIDNPAGHMTRLAVDLEDGNSTPKPLLSYLQLWPVCNPN